MNKSTVSCSSSREFKRVAQCFDCVTVSDDLKCAVLTFLHWKSKNALMVSSNQSVLNVCAEYGSLGSYVRGAVDLPLPEEAPCARPSSNFCSSAAMDGRANSTNSAAGWKSTPLFQPLLEEVGRGVCSSRLFFRKRLKEPNRTRPRLSAEFNRPHSQPTDIAT